MSPFRVTEMTQRPTTWKPSVEILTARSMKYPGNICPVTLEASGRGVETVSKILLCVEYKAGWRHRWETQMIQALMMSSCSAAI